MKQMMAPAKTFDQLQADVLVALNTYDVVSRKFQTAPVMSSNTVDRWIARIGHLWAQYLNAVKLRDAAFEEVMGR